MNTKELSIISATQRGISRALKELEANPSAWMQPVYDVVDPDMRLDSRLSSELCGYYAAMVQRWVELGKPDIFT